MITVITIILVVVFLIAMNFLYVVSEFASVKARRTRIENMAEAGSRPAKIVLPMIEEGHAVDNYVAACQIGITLSSISLGAFGQRVLAQRLAVPVGSLTTSLGLDPSVTVAATEGLALTISVWVVLVVITTLQVVLGELVPKSLAIQRPEVWSVRTAFLMRFSLWLYQVLIWIFNGSGRLILKLLGFEYREGHGHAHSPEEIELLVEESTEAGILDEEERQMLRNTFRLKDLTARQVMIHRTRMIAAPVDTPIQELIQLSLTHGYTRIPIYEESIDDILGIAHIKDLFRCHVHGQEDVRPHLRKVGYVPESLPVVDVWETLRQSGQYLVVVFDEYGGTAGILSLEDLIEEIFGELQDEFDDELALVAEDQHGRFYLRGDLLVSDVNEYLGLDLPVDMADTLGGLLIHATEGSPEVGTEVTIGGTTMRIEKIEGLGVDEISLPKPDLDVTRLTEWEVANYE